MSIDSQDIVQQIPSLRRYARALLRDVERADDLVQDCLERACRRLHLWKPGTDLRAWLFTILHNLYVNQVRRNVAAPSFVPLDDVEYMAGGGDVVDGGLQIRDLEAAIMALPEGQREVLLLVSVESMRYEEVAGILDIPVGTVMSRLHRARERVRNFMDGGRVASLRSVK